MKTLHKLYFILLLLLLPYSIIAQTLSGKVISIKDGDTIEILTADKQTFKIRLNGIDTPEKNQAFGQRARQFTSDLAYLKEVQVIVRDIDRYGRSVGDVILLDGKILNKELVRNGFAWHYKQYSKDQELAELEVQAREKKLGLWADKDPVAPWNFRRGRTSNEEVKQVYDENAFFVTKTGKKYHKMGCSALKSTIQISLEDAKKKGYQPCKLCKP